VCTTSRTCVLHTSLYRTLGRRFSVHQRTARAEEEVECKRLEIKNGGIFPPPHPLGDGSQSLRTKPAVRVPPLWRVGVVVVVAACSEAHPHPPGVGGEDLVLLAHHAGVRALVDGVGHDADAVGRQLDVARPRHLQQLPVFVPALYRAPRAREQKRED